MKFKEHIDCVTVQFQNLIELCQKISKRNSIHKLKEVVVYQRKPRKPGVTFWRAPLLPL